MRCFPLSQSRSPYLPLSRSHAARLYHKFAKVMFLQVSVCPQGGRAWQRGHAWQGGMYGGACAWQGVCMAGGVCGGGHVWQGACMVGGLHAMHTRPRQIL